LGISSADKQLRMLGFGMTPGIPSEPILPGTVETDIGPMASGSSPSRGDNKVYIRIIELKDGDKFSPKTLGGRHNSKLKVRCLEEALNCKVLWSVLPTILFR
jgi:hypothetical protein